MIKLAESQLVTVESPCQPFKVSAGSEARFCRQSEGKENMINYEVMKMQMRTEKPFEKIPNYDVNEMVIKPAFHSNKP